MKRLIIIILCALICVNRVFAAEITSPSGCSYTCPITDTCLANNEFYVYLGLYSCRLTRFTPFTLPNNTTKYIHLEFGNYGLLPYGSPTGDIYLWAPITYRGQKIGSFSTSGHSIDIPITYAGYIDSLEIVPTGVNTFVTHVLASSIFSNTPPASYTMDSGVASSAGSLLGSMISVVFTAIPLAIGTIGSLVVTRFGVKWLIGFARSHMHG